MQARLATRDAESIGDALGWEFDRCVELTMRGHGLVAFVAERTGCVGGATAWLPEPGITLIGVVLVGSVGPRQLVAAASEFAGYCQRAVLVGGDALRPEVVALAAMVDVGVVMGGASPQVVCPAGPRVAGCGLSVSEWQLLEQVREALEGGGAGCPTTRRSA